MRVATYNLRNGRAVDPASFWWRRRRSVADVIRRVNADVWAMQEVYRFQRRHLQARVLPSADWGSVGTGRNQRGGGEQVPVFFRHELFTADGSTTRWFGDTPDVAGSIMSGASLPRIATSVVLSTRDDPRKLRIVNLHLDSESAERRAQSIRQLTEWLSVEESEAATVVLGDFNGPMTDPGYEAIADLGLRSALASDSGPTSNGFGRSLDTQRQIDHVFVSTELEVVGAFIDVDAGHASDHYPVVVDLRWSDT